MTRDDNHSPYRGVKFAGREKRRRDKFCRDNAALSAFNFTRVKPGDQLKAPLRARSSRTVGVIRICERCSEVAPSGGANWRRGRRECKDRGDESERGFTRPRVSGDRQEENGIKLLKRAEERVKRL